MAKVETLEDVADKAAGRYSRLIRLGWWSSFYELKQEAMVAALSAKRTWDPRVGVPLNAYVWRACVLHLSKYVWRQSSPVSETDHRLKTMARVCRAPMTASGLATHENAEDLLQGVRWCHAVRSQIVDTLHEAQGAEDAKLAIAVLLDGQTPRKLAAACNVSPGKVHRATQRARDLIANNFVLYKMLKEL